MNAFLKLNKPRTAVEAAERQRGMHWALELLVFVAVFIVAQLVEGIIMMPGTLIMLFSNPDYLKAVTDQDLAAATAMGNELTTSDAYSILMLFATAGMILVTFLFCRLIQKRPLRTLGFRKESVLKEYLVGMVTGFLVFSAAVLLCIATGALKLEGLSAGFSVGMFALFSMGFMIQGMAEEVVCRGYFMVSVARRYSVVAAICANSLIFAALHLLNSGITVLAFINLVLFGVFASVYFIKRNSIWGVGAFHSVWNLVQGNFYGISVSGAVVTECSVLRSSTVTGRELWNGGSFGLEGGLAVTIVYLIGIVVLLAMKGKDPAGVSVAAEPTEASVRPVEEQREEM